MGGMKTKVCSKCGMEKPVSEFGTASPTLDGYNSWCKQCVRDSSKRFRETPAGIYSTIKSRSTYRKKHNKPYWKPINVSVKQFIEWYENKPKICAYCSIPEDKLHLRQEGFDSRVTRLEVDCKDNEKGYVKDNLVLACHLCNFIKLHIFNHDEMIEIGQKYIRPKWEKLDVEVS